MIEYEPTKKSSIPAYTCPEKWEEVTTGQVMQYAEWEKTGTDLPWKLEIFTGIPRDVWAAAPADEVEGHLGMLLFTLTPFDWAGLPMPKTLTINGNTYDVPKTLKSQPFGAVMAINAAVDVAIPRDEEEPNTDGLFNLIPYVVSCAMERCTAGGLFDEERAKAFIETVNTLPAREVLPVGFFYLQTSALAIIRGRGTLRTALTVTK